MHWSLHEGKHIIPGLADGDCCGLRYVLDVAEDGLGSVGHERPCEDFVAPGAAKDYLADNDWIDCFQTHCGGYHTRRSQKRPSELEFMRKKLQVLFSLKKKLFVDRYKQRTACLQS